MAVGQPYDSLTYLLQKAAKTSIELLDRELADLELSARQYLLLALVGKGDQVSQQELAKRLGVDPTVVVKLVDDLEQRGVVTRTRFADDRRQHRLALTPAGKVMLRDAHTRHQRAERELTRTLGSRRNDLRDLLAEALHTEH